MCKIMIMTNTSKLSKKQVNDILKTNAKYMQQDDGFGYSLINSDETRHSAKFLKPRKVSKLIDKGLETSYKQDLFRSKRTYETSGTMSDSFKGGLLVHGRISTNSVSLTNTHPISKKGWSLIHNGVVEDDGPDYEMITSNDSEHCLERLMSGVSNIEKYISGYYAIGALDSSNYLHIVKDNIASLYCTYVLDLETYIFATTSQLIEKVCNTLKVTYDDITEVESNIYLKFDDNGNFIDIQKIKPKGRTAYSDSLSSKSLGYDLTSIFNNSASQDITEMDYDREAFISEIKNFADSSYTFIFHETNKSIDIETFFSLSIYDQINSCTVIRPDGTIVSPFNYDKDVLYGT